MVIVMGKVIADYDDKYGDAKYDDVDHCRAERAST